MKDTAAATRDESFARHYERSRLKQHYDTVVVDDTRGISGYLWKFPSEGSNRGASSRRALVFPLMSSSTGAMGKASLSSASLVSTGAATMEGRGDPPYPRKCDRCETAWFSDRKAERHHRKSCRSAKEKVVGNEKKAGSGGSSDSDGKDGSETKRQLDTESKSAAKQAAARLGVARRVWCEVDSSLSQLQVCKCVWLRSSCC